MHDFTMPQWAIERVVERHGRLHVFDDLTPSKTALIVIDLQNGFMVPECTARPVATAIETVPNVNRLARVLRGAGGRVFWLKHTLDENDLQEWSNWLALGRPEDCRRRMELFRDGTPGHDLHPALEILPEDEIVLKHRFSAFLPGSSNLPQLLRERDIDTILVAGTVTNVCCESSARDAMMMNFRTIMVCDANSAFTDQEHSAALASFYTVFGDVMNTNEIERIFKI